MLVTLGIAFVLLEEEADGFDTEQIRDIVLMNSASMHAPLYNLAYLMRASVSNCYVNFLLKAKVIRLG